ncbi:triacylglycerol lipase OBL1 [Capsicum galapagoense]
MASSSACNKSFCDNYMLLKPEECSVLDLARILFSGKNIGQKDFVDCPNDEMTTTKEPLSRRWVIFISLLVQKVLIATAKPLAGFGNAIEYWLNLLNVNGGFFRLIFNSVRGKTVIPDKESANFLSFIGNLDKRVELVDNSRCVEELGGRRGYDEAISIMAAKAAYENKACIETTVKDKWKMDLIGCFDFWNDYQQKATTQAFVLQDKNVDPELIVVAFRGTEFFNSDDWISDFNLSWYEISGMGKVHAGFMKALGLQKSNGWPKDIEQTDNNQLSPAYYFLRKLLKQLLEKNEKARFLVTGHSLGGALAILFPAILAYHEESWLLKRLEGVYTFGQPRVGDETFVEYMKGQLSKHEVPYYRVVYSNDMVPRLPYDNATFGFKHFGTCIYYNSLYKEKILGEEPDKNGLALLLFLPKMLNAAWELIRSFILPCVNGRKYTEGGLLLFMRVVGLILPGIPAHCPQDYVNATRLGSSDQSYATENAAKYQKIGLVPA